MAGRRLALVIDASAGNHFPGHPTSSGNIERLQAVLSSVDIGQFAVTAITAAELAATETAIQQFFSQSQADDLLLFYFVGRLLVTGTNQLRFALPATDPFAVSPTSISSEFALTEIKTTAARKIVIVLDALIGVHRDNPDVGPWDQQLLVPGKSEAILAASAGPNFYFPEYSASPQVSYSLTELIVQGLLEQRANCRQMTVADLSSYLSTRAASGSSLVTRMDDSAGQIVLVPSQDLQPKMIEVSQIERGLSQTEVVADTKPPILDTLPGSAELPEVLPDENVQFTVYRPATLETGRWQRMLVFTHIDEAPDQAPNQKTAAQEVAERAHRILADEFQSYRELAADSQFPVPRESEITLVPDVPKITFNPPRRSFVWAKDLRVHDENFLLKASDELPGSILVRGRLSIFLGHLLLADIALTFRVESAPLDPAASEQHWARSSARPFRKVFASYSHLDMQIVEAMEHHVKALGYDYLRDVVHLRSGQAWSDRLLGMINDADIFQLFWSSNSARSSHVEQEWRYALALNREAFVRPAFWEMPMPTAPEPLRNLHFYRLPMLVPVSAQSSASQVSHSLSERARSEETNALTLPAPPLAQSEPGPMKPGQLAPAAEARHRRQRKRFGFWSAMLGGTAAACLVIFASFFGGMLWFSRQTAQMQARATPPAAALPLAQATAAATETPALVAATPVPAVSPAQEATSTPALASATPRRTRGPSSDAKRASSDHSLTKPKPPSP